MEDQKCQDHETKDENVSDESKVIIGDICEHMRPYMEPFMNKIMTEGMSSSNFMENIMSMIDLANLAKNDKNITNCINSLNQAGLRPMTGEEFYAIQDQHKQKSITESKL